MTKRGAAIFTILLMLSACSGGKVAPAPTFPLQIANELPKENQLVMPEDMPWTIPENAKSYSVSLPNGMRLIIEPIYETTTKTEINFGENYAFIEKPNGEKTKIAAGWGFGDFEKTLILDKNAGRIYIRESIWNKPEQLVREHDLKCDADECAFFTTKDCMLNPANISAAEIEKQMSSVADANGELPQELKEKYLTMIFMHAMSGEKENVEYFFDRERLNKYFRFDAGISEGYNWTYRPLLIEYGKKCFRDNTIKWPEKQND